MVIHVWGNLSSGKTTAAKWLAKQLQCKSYHIDDYRKKYGTLKEPNEDGAWMEMQADVTCGTGNCIIESSGTSWRLKYFPIDIIVVMNTPVTECINRCYKRVKDYKKIPWPWERQDFGKAAMAIKEKLDAKILFQTYRYSTPVFYCKDQESLKEQLPEIKKLLK